MNVFRHYFMGHCSPLIALVWLGSDAGAKGGAGPGHLPALAEVCLAEVGTCCVIARENTASAACHGIPSCFSPVSVVSNVGRRGKGTYC